MVKIRKANKTDGLGIAIVNVYTWKTTYSDLIPSEIIDGRIEALIDMTARIEREIENTKNYIITAVNDTIVGFCTYGKSRDDSFLDYGEIYAIYVLKGFQGLGLGKKLFLSAAKELKEEGYSSVIINCLKRNPSVEFYKRLGGKVVGEREDEYKGSMITEEIIGIKI